MDFPHLVPGTGAWPAPFLVMTKTTINATISNFPTKNISFLHLLAAAGRGRMGQNRLQVFCPLLNFLLYSRTHHARQAGFIVLTLFKRRLRLQKLLTQQVGGLVEVRFKFKTDSTVCSFPILSQCPCYGRRYLRSFRLMALCLDRVMGEDGRACRLTTHSE